MTKRILLIMVCLFLTCPLFSCSHGGHSVSTETPGTVPLVNEPLVSPTEAVTDRKSGVSVQADVSCGEGTEAGILFGLNQSGQKALGWYGYLITLKSDALTLYLANDDLRALETVPLSSDGDVSLRVTLRDSICAVYVDGGDSPGALPLILRQIETGRYTVCSAVLSGRADAAGTPEATFTDEVVGADDVYVNPVLDGYADPDVLLWEGTYYLYGTGGYGYQVHVSSDLSEWKNAGTAAKPNLWGITENYWAPDVKYINGRFYMVVTCSEHIGIAVSDSPLGPFKELHDKPLFDSSIDGHLFQDEDGTVYLYYVSWRSGHNYGIYGVKLDGDFRPVAETEKLLLFPLESWEKQMSGVVEGPYMIKRDGIYYLTYSGSNYQSRDYAVGYGTSSSPLGTFRRYAGNPILIGSGPICGTGHHCIVPSLDGESLWIVYHCHNSLTQVHARRICIDRLFFTENGALEVAGPTSSPQLTQKAEPAGK